MAKRVRVAVEKPKKKYTMHGCRNTRLYEIWWSMLGRCRYKNLKNYKFYGAKGIKVCEGWNSFIVFRDWALANGYTDDLSIDRKETTGNYEPSNCRWVTQRVQIENRNVHKVNVTIFGESKSFREWSKDGRCKTTYSGLHGRISRGWNPEEALTTPPMD